jgi:tRNA pseudouridine55 synthase
MDGIIAVWKPETYTSHDIVAIARRAFQQKRIGHTGTLDPMVTGVLPICLGKSTRFVEYIQELPKQYEAEMTFGIATDTEDWTGTSVAEVDQVNLSREQVEQILASFQGEIMQTPPMYSALKQNGVKLIDLARQGIEVERKARPVTIYNLEILSFSSDKSRPKLRFRADCSKGTYIRTLCVDIGKALGYPAMMSELVRTQSGPFREEDCITIKQLKQIPFEQWADKIVDERTALAHLPAITIPNWAALKLIQGLSLHTNRLPVEVADQMGDTLSRLYDENQHFVGLFQIDSETSTIKAVKVFATQP